MSGTFIQIFGPWIQFLVKGSLLLLFGTMIAILAYHGEVWLLRKGKKAFWLLPFPALAAGLVYGVLRFEGWLVFPTDGWDPIGMWNYTYQNSGASILFLCGFLLIGTALAAYQNRFPMARER